RHLEIECTVCPNRHATRKPRRREHDCIFRSPFHSKFFRVHEQYFHTHPCCKSKPEAFQRRQKWDDVRIYIIIAFILKYSFNSPLMEKYCVLPRTDDQFTPFLDFVIMPFPENHIFPKLIPLDDIGHLSFEKIHLT